MKQSPRASKTPFILSQSLQQRLNMYALAASAAGVSLLASAQPSEAKIVYTKTHQIIGTNGVYNLDLNHDGIVDFLLLESGYATFNGTRGNNTLLAKEALGNAVVGRISSSGRHLAAALKRGAQIGPGEHVIRGGSRGETMVATWASDGPGGPTAGQWVNVTSRYLGLKFKVGEKIHYGWARLTVQLPGNFVIKATLTGYAYETVPGKPILAGQTADNADAATVSLGRLALGAAGATHRR
jgi:hypothetical protein